jgi:cell shape-determining protein MreC
MIEVLQTHLNTLIADYRVGTLGFQDTLDALEELINEYAAQSNNKEDVAQVRKALRKIALQIRRLEHLDLKLKAYKQTNNELRLALGLNIKS